jgi:UDP-N-acetylmuramoylalanine--D-glutamate ligase
MRKEQRIYTGNIDSIVLSAIQSPTMNTKLRTVLMPFEGFGMRLCHVNTTKGVRYINDAIATNPNAGWYSLETINNPVIWIMGGKLKLDYATLLEVAEQKVKAIFLIGVDSDTRKYILAQFSSIIPVIEESITIEQAVKDAYSIAKSGDAVLFSPSNSPDEGFNRYEQGEMFCQYVANL